MANYKLEGGIPINKVVRHKREPSKHFDYPFKTMDFGEKNTFLLPLISENFKPLPGRKKSLAKVAQDRVRHQSRRYAKNFKPDFNITCRERNFKDHGEVGVRVWRVK